MVCSRGESPTHHTNQMKLFNAAFAAVAVIAASCLAAVPANADSQQCRSDGFGGYRCSGDGGTSTIRRDNFGGYRLKNWGTKTNCTLRSDGFGGYRTSCY